ncbi:MAG: hypothetical protein JWL68_4128 [Actinomycetia bacterium]|nr:hypothetical protein [Actinomycetes bacterium]
MTEGHACADFHQPVGLGGIHRLGLDPESAGRPPQQRGIAGRFCRREQQQLLGLHRKRRQPPPEDVLDTAGKGPRAREAEPAGQLRRSHPAGQLKQGQRVAAGLSDDSVTDPLIQPPGDDRVQHRPGVSIRQSLRHQPGKTGQVALRGGITGAQYHGDRFGI